MSLDIARASAKEAMRARIAAGHLEGPRVNSVCTDSRTLKPGDLFFALKGGNFDGHDFIFTALEKGAGGVVADKEWMDKNPLPKSNAEAIVFSVPDTLGALGDLAKFRRQNANCRFVGITGSNGKTSVKEMTAHLLASKFRVHKSPASFNNYVGLPLTLFSMTGREDYVVLEMGTSGPGEIRRLAQIGQPGIGVVTNVSETHLEGLGSIDKVAIAKAELVQELPENGTAILNGDDPRVRAMSAKTLRGVKVILFGKSPDCDIRAGQIQPEGDGISFVYNGQTKIFLPVPGEHNVMNALASMSVALRAGLTVEEIAAAFKTYQGPKMRLTRIVAGDVLLINDAYNANPASVAAALSTFAGLKVKGRKFLVLGDMLELGEAGPDHHRRIGKLAGTCGASLIITLGNLATYINHGALESGMNESKVLQLDGRNSALEKLHSELQPGDAVLIKGSRGMALELLVEELRKHLESHFIQHSLTR